MNTVDVSSLGAQLADVLDLVRNGATIEILDRNVPIARLVPVGPTIEARKSAIPTWLEGLARSGVVKLGAMKGVPEILDKRPPGPAKTGALEALLEDRRTGR
jgi:antitoxin (DNA-binding transcriptional repressor) of toxin-antitoxin stability system